MLAADPGAGRRAACRRADHGAVERRHAEYFGALVENADWPAERQAEWAERLRTEEENLRRRHPVVLRPRRHARCRTSSASSGCSGRCATACPRAAPGSRSCCAVPMRSTTAPASSCCSSRPSPRSRSGDDERGPQRGRPGPAAWAARRTIRAARALARSWVLPLEDDLEGALAWRPPRDRGLPRRRRDRSWRSPHSPSACSRCWPGRPDAGEGLLPRLTRWAGGSATAGSNRRLARSWCRSLWAPAASTRRVGSCGGRSPPPTTPRSAPSV